MPLSRRQFLVRGAAAAGAVAVASAARAPARAASQDRAQPLQAGPDDPLVWFTHSVASGDPYPDGVLLWTRAYPLDDRASVTLTWVVATDPALADVVATGQVEATADTDWCAKALPDGLEPNSTYWYGFRADGGSARSAVGRTRTAPAPGQDVDRLRFVLLTCNNPEEGRFNALARLAEEDDSISAVIHHGDYVYEYGRPGIPFAPWNTCVTLEDYRARYAAYRTFPQLRDAHRMHPWICLWDDGDLANGTWRDGAFDHDAELHGDWSTRRANALRAMLEWTPTRLTGEVTDTPLARTVPFGDLAHVVVVDAMANRDPGHGDALRSFDSPELQDPERRTLSQECMAWVGAALATSPARWTILTTQALVMHWGAPGTPSALPPEVSDYFGRRDGNQLYGTAWNGYPADRQRLFDHVEAAGLPNLIATSGDAHMSITGELARDPYDPATYDQVTSRGSLGVEFCCASTSSVGLSKSLGIPPRTVAVAAEAASLAGNPHQRWLDLDANGYPIVEVRPDGMTTDYWFVDTADSLSDGFAFAARLTSADGSRRLVHDRSADVLPPSRSTAPVPTERASNPVALDELGGAAATEPSGNRRPLPASGSGLEPPVEAEPAPLPVTGTSTAAIALGAAAAVAAVVARGRDHQ